MFDVLAFVYQSYFQLETCPEAAQLPRKLTALGFAPDEIEDALAWLRGLDHAARGSLGFATLAAAGGLRCAAQPWLRQPHPDSVRIYPRVEQLHLGADALGFIRFLESSGALPAHMREVIVDRALAAPGAPVGMDDLKLIVLMVYWSFGCAPDALVLDELCEQRDWRISH